MPKTLIIFDLDGTLVDTADDLIDSLNYTLTTEKLDPVSKIEFMELVGQGARVMIQRAYASKKLGISDAKLNQLFLLFIDHYKDAMPGSAKPYPHVIDAIKALSKEGYKFAICTNKYEGMAIDLINTLGLAGYFCALTGGDTFDVKKPNGDHILRTAKLAEKNCGLAFEKVIMIGDSINDIKAAQNAKIPSIGVTFGYTDRPIQEFGPTHIISSFTELTKELVAEL